MKSNWRRLKIKIIIMYFHNSLHLYFDYFNIFKYTTNITLYFNILLKMINLVQMYLFI